MNGSFELGQSYISFSLPGGVLIEELLSEVMRNTSYSTPDTLVTSRVSWLDKAFDLVLLTFCTCCWISFLKRAAQSAMEAYRLA